MHEQDNLYALSTFLDRLCLPALLKMKFSSGDGMGSPLERVQKMHTTTIIMTTTTTKAERRCVDKIDSKTFLNSFDSKGKYLSFIIVTGLFSIPVHNRDYNHPLIHYHTGRHDA